MNIVVTGASRGIGYETVKKLAADPAHRIIAIARSADKLNNLKKECVKLYGHDTVIPITADLTLEGAPSSIAISIKKHFSSLDILINNAAAFIHKPFQTITVTELQNLYVANVFSVFGLIQQCIPLFKRGAHVVNISSMGAYQGSAKFAGLSAYSSSKGALAVLSECLAEELKPQQITVNCLCLGAVDTEMLKAAFPDYTAPLKAEQMAQYIAHFAISGQNYFNGKIIPVSLSTP